MTRRLTLGWRLRATAAAFALPPLIHLISLERIAGWATRATRRPDDSVDDVALAEWVDRVLARLPPPWKRTCLRRAVVLHYLLGRAGRPAGLRIGVRRGTDRALAAHAWLVRDGEQPWLESDHEHAASYQVLAAFPPSGPGTP